MSDPWEGLLQDPDFRAWCEHQRAVVLPQIRESELTVSLVPKNGECDVKFAVELGFSIMLDKPIIAVIQPGTRVPAKLRQIADHIVVVDMTDPKEGMARLQGLLGEAMEVSRATDEALLKAKS